MIWRNHGTCGLQKGYLGTNGQLINGHGHCIRCIFGCGIRGSIKISTQFERFQVLDLSYSEIISVPTSLGQLRLLEFYIK